MVPLKEIAKREPFWMPVDRTIEASVRHMMETKTSVVVFLDGQKPVGILTERDIVSFLHAGTRLDTPLAAVQNPPLTVREDKTLLFGLNMLIDNNIRRIVVVGPDGEFLGVVTQEDLIRQLEGELFQKDSKIMDIILARQQLRTVSVQETLADVIEVMQTYKVGSVLVLEGNMVSGIITERDILKFADAGTLLDEPAGVLMSRPVVSVTVESSVSEVLAIMKQRTIRRILVTYHDGSPFRVISNRDILRNLENSYLDFLNRKIKHAREMLDFLPEVIVEVIDVGGEQVIQWCNRKTKQEFGKDMANLPVTSLIPETTWKNVYPDIVGRGRIEKTRVEIGDRIFELSASYMKMQREGIIQAILIDVTAEVLMSARDFLTGVYNRRKFEDILKSEAGRVKRYGQTLALAFLDIDHFKTVNDTFGHQAGDRVLRELTELVAQNIREVDYLARYGGEEFVLLSPGTDVNGMQLLAEKIRTSIERHAFSVGCRITASFGVAQYRSDETVSRFIERSDAALYRAKAKGRNRVERSEGGVQGTETG